MAEAAGTVNEKSKDGTKGKGRIYVNFYRNGKTLVGRTLTESDGYFSYMGLQPGNYVARMDSIQLTKIKMIAAPDFKEFKVKESKDGDFIEGLDFTLLSTVKDSTESTTPKVEPQTLPKVEKATEEIINYGSNGIKKSDTISEAAKKPLTEIQNLAEKKTPVFEKKAQEIKSKITDVKYTQSFPAKNKQDESNIAVSKVTLKNKKSDSSHVEIVKQQPMITTAGQAYSVRYGSYKSENDALLLQQKITTTTGKPAILILEDGAYALWIEGFSTNRDASEFLSSLEKNEFKSNVNEKLVTPKNINSDSVSVTKYKNIITAVNKGKTVNYGPWKIQNDMVVYADSVTKIYAFEPKRSNTRGISTRISQPQISNMVSTTTVKPLPLPVTKSSIIELNQNNKITVINGQQFSIQVGDFIFDRSALIALKKISTITKLPVIVVIRKGFYNLVIDGYPTRKEAKLFVDQLKQMGYNGTVIKDNS